MDFKKAAKSFNMYYGTDCEKICFSGMSLPILRGGDASICASLSVGGCIAAARRKDGRFTAKSDCSQKYIGSNILELEYHKNQPMLNFLNKIKKSGAELSGMDTLFLYNTKIYEEYEALLLSAAYCFCPKMPMPQEFKDCLSDSLRDFVSLVGKKGTLLFTQGERNIYIKFPDDKIKIVLCCLNEKNKLQNSDSDTVKDAVRSLAAGDCVRFGSAVTAEYARLIDEGCAGRQTKMLFKTAVSLKDALLYGVLEQGGVFAAAENKKVNAFIQNLKKEYENFCGNPPDFYVTMPENSGINFILREKDL